MLIPQTGRKLEDFSLDLIDKCTTSRKDRINAGALWKQYYFNGTSQAAQAPFNLCYPHIDRTSSYLFSPSDINFRLHSGIGDAEKNVPVDWQETWMQKLQFLKKKPAPLKWPDWQEMRHVAAHYLNSQFFDADINFSISMALDWALVKNSAFVKTVWENNGLSAYVFQQEQIGVYREDINGLDRQEAFICTSFITMSTFLAMVKNHPEKEAMIASVRRRARKSKAGEQYENQFLHQVIIGGIATSANPSGNIKGSVNIFGTPYPKISPEIQNDLLVCHEIWVKDDEREDLTTIQLIEPDIIIEGKLRHRNLSGIRGDSGFRQICANPVDGYFWGQSELMALRPLQDMANVRVAQINRALKRRARPARAISGFTGDADQARKAIDSPDGLLVEGQGQGMKVETLQPETPTDMYENLKSVVEMFDQVGGFSPMMQGRGEPGVRSHVQTETMLRTSSPRMRDRALMIERQCGDIGDFCFKLLQAKVGTQFTTKSGESFLLSQLPEDTKVVVDSHSSSPAFSEDNRNLAYSLAKLGAIDHESLLEMINPPNVTELADKARQREEAQQKLIASHPELLEKLHGKKH